MKLFRSNIFWAIIWLIVVIILFSVCMYVAFNMPDKGEITYIDAPRDYIRTWIDPNTGVEYFICIVRGGEVILPRYDSDGEVMVHHNEIP